MNVAPQGYNTVMPYLLVSHPAKMLTFMNKAFGGEEMTVHKGDDGRIAHCEMRIGESVIMMGGAEQGVPCHLYIYVKDVDACYAAALTHGAVSLEKPADKPYGDRVGAVKDPCGNTWWMGTRKAH